jgi:integrase
MPRPRKSVPTYSHHKPSGQAYARIPDGSGGRRVVYLGRFNSPESQDAYRRLLAEALTGDGSTAFLGGPSTVVTTASCPSVNQVIVLFVRWAHTHYRRADGKPVTEVDEIKRSLGPVRRLHGQIPAAEFGPKKLTTVRDVMIATGWCRTLINRRVDRIKRMFRWAAAEELVPVTVYQSLRTVPGLQKGRTAAREKEPVKPVDPAHVTAVLPHLSRHTRAMIELQTLTGMRPGEVCRLTVAEIDRTGDVWVYRPEQHKTAHRGKRRIIPFGPRARASLVEFLRNGCEPPVGWEAIDLADADARHAMAIVYEQAGRIEDARRLRDLSRPLAVVGGCVVDVDTTVFSPAREQEERFRVKRALRYSPVQPSQQFRRKANPKRRPAESYPPHALTAAVARACKRAEIPRWHPNQLRHTFATTVRRLHGIEAAQVLLGHSRADVTQVYAERDELLAVRVAAAIG